jgi:hypothetical protein
VLTFPRLRVGYLIPATLNRDHQAGEHARGVLVPTSMVPQETIDDLISRFPEKPEGMHWN